MRLRSKEISVFNMSALDLFASALGAFILITLVLFPYFPNTGDSQERVDEVKAQLAQANAGLEETSAELEHTSVELEQTSAELEEVRAQLNPALEQELQAVRGQLGSCETRRQEAQAALNSCQAEQRQAASMDSALGACESRNQRMQQELQSCEQQLRKKFVLVVISWSTGDDVDLHIIDPAGRGVLLREEISLRFPGQAGRGQHSRPGQRDLAAPGCRTRQVPGVLQVLQRLRQQRTGPGRGADAPRQDRTAGNSVEKSR